MERNDSGGRYRRPRRIFTAELKADAVRMMQERCGWGCPWRTKRIGVACRCRRGSRSLASRYGARGV